MKLDRRTYAGHYGPTTGDRVRLADTDLIIRIEHDATVYGDEAKFGGGKVLRDGMGQSPAASREHGSPDLVITSVVIVDASRIHDRESFHDVFAEAFGFPGYYGRNLDAWIDCMSGLDEDDGQTTIDCPRGSVVTLQLDNVDVFAKRCPDLYAALIECAAFVNWRRIEQGQPAVLALSFHKP